MASLTERFSGKEPLSFEVTVPVLGGQFLVYDSAAALRTTTGAIPKVKIAAHGALNWLGMAKYDATPGGEFDESTLAFTNVPINHPIPHVVAAAHMGVYEVVNAGNVNVNPGDDIEVVTDAGLPGKATAGAQASGMPTYTFVAMVGGRAVVGVSVSKGPAAPGTLFRLRLGRN